MSVSHGEGMADQQTQDQIVAESLLDYLTRFNHLKQERWEQLEDSFQMSNKMGTPTEDWIIPPDEKKIEKILLEDPDYTILREAIEGHLPKVKALAELRNFDTQHKLDWIKFTDPLIGTVALEEGMKCVSRFIDFLAHPQ